MARACFPNVPPFFYTGNIFSSVSICAQDANYTYATRQGILTKIRACEHSQKFCEHERTSPYKKVQRNLEISLEKLRFPENLIPRILGKNLAFFRVNLHYLCMGILKISRESGRGKSYFKIHEISREFARNKFSKGGH